MLRGAPALRLLRVALALSLLREVSCLRLGSRAEQLPERKVFGPDHRSCRHQKARENDDNAVIGGTVVDNASEFPFVAWIGDHDGTLVSQFCGGSLISDRIVLTAGHCLYSNDKANTWLWVRLKLTDSASTDGVLRSVVNWRRHPQFDAKLLANDIALMVLNESVPAGLVRPVSLSDGSKSFEHSSEKTVVGWGSMDEGCLQVDTHLREAKVPFGTDGPNCTSPGSHTLSANSDFDSRKQCCAGDYAGYMHYPGCGDSGGPLLAKDGDWWSQVGLVSYSYGVPWPDVFTRVSYFRDWIEETSAELVAEGEHPVVRERRLGSSTPP